MVKIIDLRVDLWGWRPPQPSPREILDPPLWSVIHLIFKETTLNLCTTLFASEYDTKLGGGKDLS